MALCSGPLFVCGRLLNESDHLQVFDFCQVDWSMLSLYSIKRLLISAVVDSIFFCSERLSCSNISYLANNSPLINHRQSINFNDERMKTTTDIVVKHEYSREF